MIWFMKLKTFLHLFVCVCVHMHMLGTHAEVRGQISTVGSSFYYMGFRIIISLATKALTTEHLSDLDL